ncbi:MAG: lytic transglycosylase domain-containing protein [Candidatus Baltobacteraceae bacterium]
MRDLADPQINIAYGSWYLRYLHDRYDDNDTLAVAAYNAGPGAVEKFGGVPPYAETQNYVGNVMESYRQYQTPGQ